MGFLLVSLWDSGQLLFCVPGIVKNLGKTDESDVDCMRNPKFAFDLRTYQRIQYLALYPAVVSRPMNARNSCSSVDSNPFPIHPGTQIPATLGVFGSMDFDSKDRQVLVAALAAPEYWGARRWIAGGS